METIVFINLLNFKKGSSKDVFFKLNIIINVKVTLSVYYVLMSKQIMMKLGIKAGKTLRKDTFYLDSNFYIINMLFYSILCVSF